MSRLYLFYLYSFLIIICFSSFVHAGNDLEKWNSEVGRTVRQSHSDKLAQTTYKEISSKNVKVAQDMRTVYPQIETSAQVAGSKTRVVAEAVLDVDKEKVARDWNKKLSKVGKVTNAVGAALVIGGYIMDAVDWVMDPENNTIKKKPDPNSAENTKYSSNFIYYGDGGTAYSLSDYGRSVFAKTVANNSGFSGAVFSSASKHPNYSCNYAGNYNCVVSVNYTRNGASYIQNYTLSIKANPDYNSDHVDESKEVSEAEKEQVLKDLLNDPKHADLAKQMIGNSYTIGSDNPEPDPNIVNDIKDAQKGALKSDDPKGDGRTRTDPKIDTGTEVKGESKSETKSETQVDEKTVTNPDGSTTTTGTNITNNTTITNTNINIPPACEYLAFLCEWVGWTKEEPELVDEKLQIQERDVTDYKYEEHLKFGSSCPFSEKTEILNMGVGVMKVKYNLDFFCDFSREAKPTIIGIGHLGALIFLLIGIRSGASG